MLAASVFVLGTLVAGGAIHPPQMAEYDPDRQSRRYPQLQERQQLSEKQKRALLVPTVRATTDCIANAVAADERFAQASVNDTLSTLIPPALSLCLPALRELAEAHDRIYGIGTDVNFATGPYLSDLPRALTARLKDRIAAAKQIEAERLKALELRKQAAEASRDDARTKFWACVDVEARHLVASGEGAQLVTRAVLVSCHREFEALVDAGIYKSSVDGATYAYEPTFRSELQKSAEDKVLSAVMSIMADNRKQPVVTAATSASARNQALDCIRKLAPAALSTLAEREQKVKTVVELCRPEIETTARALFLEDRTISLDAARELVFDQAMKAADTALAPE